MDKSIKKILDDLREEILLKSIVIKNKSKRKKLEKAK